MPDLPTRLDYFAIGRDFVTQRAKRIDPAQVDIEGSDVNLFVGVAAMMTYAVTLQLAFAANRLLLDGAEGEDLDRYAFDRYGMTRKGASAAVVPVRIYRDAVGAGGSIVVGTKLLTLSGVEYVTVNTITFAPDDVSVTTGIARAAQAGKSTQVGANSIRRFAKPTLLFDQTLKVNNDVRAAGGEDKEDDDTFRERVRGFWTAARRGTLGAIEFGALQVEGVVSAQAVEALNGSGAPARVVLLYIADGSGVSNIALANVVIAALDDYRAGGIWVIVSSSVPQIADVVLQPKFAANVDTVALTDTVRSAIVEYVNSLPVNGTLERSALYAVLRRFTGDGLIVDDATLVAPTGDLVPAAGSTLRTTISNVTTV